MSVSNKVAQYQKVMSKYVPAEYVSYVVDLLIRHPVQFRVAKPRKTKLGDFRAEREGLHRITVNGDLNPYSFLITTIHEFAHLVTFEDYGPRVKPHGTEWQNVYSKMLFPVVEAGHLPKDVSKAIERSLLNVKASSCTDQNLHRVLIKYDKPKEGLVILETLEKESVFELNGKSYRKGNLRRTRYVCTNTNNQRKYLISALAQVKKIE
ncbi:SprT-like domain-containing protein [Crocinitomicaceae bacterium]|nr:SprT-like domain-containing protein [Crocinitomicaceae bacterium]MDC0257758.1 SprT-like domain-containing protein [Crocinitomicaceae bacterium]